MWSCVKLRRLLMVCACMCVREQAGVCPCARSRNTEGSLWYGSVPQGAGIWHIVSVGNSNYLQLSTCFDPFRNFHFLRSFYFLFFFRGRGLTLEKLLEKEKPHYGLSVSWKSSCLGGQCQPQRCSFSPETESPRWFEVKRENLERVVCWGWRSLEKQMFCHSSLLSTI